VKQKQKGGDLHRVREPEEEEETPNLLEALRLSVERTRGGGHAPNGSGNGTAGTTKEELQEQARKLGIQGRSKMSKTQLAKAVASAQ
jgi:hypothetical protein